MAAYGAARLAFLGFNNLKHDTILKSPIIKKIIKKDPSLNSILADRFIKWKKYYIK